MNPLLIAQPIRLIRYQLALIIYFLLILFAHNVCGQASNVSNPDHKPLGQNTIDSCKLYPIGLSESSLSGIEPGDSVTFFSDLNATDNFAWIVLESDGLSVEEVILSSFKSPQNAIVSDGKLYLANTQGAAQSYFTGLTDFERPEELEVLLDSLLGVEIAVPVWDEIDESASATKFHLVDVAIMRLVDYDLTRFGQITVEFLSMADCTSDYQPPEVDYIEVETFKNTPVKIKLKARVFNGGNPVFHIMGDQKNGVLSFVPEAATVTYLPINFTGQDVFHYYVDDGFMSSETAEVMVTVLDATGGRIDGRENAEGGSSESLALAAGNISDQQDQFTFRVWDGDLFSNVATVTINVNSNQPPQAQNIDLTVAENRSLAFPLIASDPDGDALQYQLLTLPQSGEVDGDLPNVEYTPPAFFNGTVEFDYEVEDSKGAKDTATVTIEMLPVNDAPVALFNYTTNQGVPPFDVAFDGSDSYDDLAIDEYRWDFDGDGTVDSTIAQPLFQFDSAETQIVSLTVLDAEGLSDTQEQVLVFNQPPEVDIVSPSSLDRFKVGETIDILIEASDSDGLVETIILLDEAGDEVARTNPSIPLFSLNDLAVESYAFSAKAIDNEGATGESDPLTLSVYRTTGNFIVRPLLLEATLTEVSSEDNAEQNYTIRYSATDPELTPQFEDIRDTGTYLEMLSTSDDASEKVDLSFDFPFYGQGFTSLYIGTNGLIVLGSSEVAETDATQYYRPADFPSLPSQEAPRNLIAPWWGDLIPTNLGAGEYGGGVFESVTEIHYQDFGDRLIIQYTSIGDYTTCSGPFNFQVILYASGVIDFVYDEMYFEYDPIYPFECNPIGIAEYNYIVGLQNFTRDIGAQVDQSWRIEDSPMLRFEPAAVEGVMTSRDFFAENGYDQPVSYTITTQNNTIDSLPDNPVWFEVTSAGSTLSTGEMDSIQVDFISDSGFPVGRYEGMIRVDHTQPGLDPYIVNVALDIVADAPQVSWVNPVLPGYVQLGQPLSLEVNAEDPNGFIQSLSIFVDDDLLVDFVAAPYTSSWTPSGIGRYVLKAVAIDNDGNVVESIFDLVVTEDTDNDDLPDQWELDFLGTMNFGGLDSPDGDDLTNLKELFLGTNPNVTDTGNFDNLSPSIDLSITPDTGETPLTVNFDASDSIDRDGKIVSYEWDFNGDGIADQITTTATIEYTYTEPNLYTTFLRVVDDEGASSTTTKLVHAKVPGTSVPPSALIDSEVNVPATGQLIDFSAARSVDPDGFIVDYRWSFSDGMELSGLEVQRHFMTNGPHSVTLTVTDNEGKTDVVTEWLSVLGPNRSPGTVDDIWVVRGAAYDYLMIDRDCGKFSYFVVNPYPGNWSRTGENSVYNISLYETPVYGYGRATEVGYTFHIDQAGDYYLAILKKNSVEAFFDTISGGGLDVYLDNKRISPDNGFFNEIDAEPTWGRYGQFYLEPGYHTIAFEKRLDSYFEIYRVAVAKTKESLPTTGSVTQSPQVNSFENEIIPIPEIKILSSADEVKLGEVVDLSLDLAASNLPSPALYYFWGTPFERPNTISPILDNYISNDPSGIRFAPSVLESGSNGLAQIRLGLIDSKGQTDEVYKYLRVTDPIAELNDPSQIILESEDIESFPGWGSYGESVVDGSNTLTEASNIRGETYLANGIRTGTIASLDLPVSVSQNTRYVAFYYVPHIEFFELPSDRTQFDAFFDEDGLRTNESNRFSRARVEYPVNGGRKSAFVDMRYQLAAWNWFSVIDSGSASEINLTLNVDKNKHVAFDGLKLIPVETVDTANNQIPELIVTTEKVNDLTYAFDASQSIDTDGEILGYLWHFGDGTVSRSAIPQHTYAESGTYDVTLHVLDEDLGLSEWSSTVEVVRNDVIAPIARLSSSSDQGTVPFEVDFSGALSTDTESVLSYEIRFPDGRVVFGSDAKYIFTEPGEYQVELIVRYTDGDESKTFRKIEAFAPGIAYNQSYVFEDSDINATEFVGEDWQSTLVSLGNRLNTLTSSSNIEDSAWFDFTPERSGVYQLFVAASYTHPSDTCDLETEMDVNVIFGEKLDERSVVLEKNNNPIRTRKWNPAGTFDLVAFTPVNVRLQAKPGVVDLSIDALRWIAVDEGVLSKFTVTLSDRNEITVDASASTSLEGIVAYNWDFGDNSNATEVTAEHSYTDAGLYRVTLTVTDAAGRKASASETVRILPENNLPQIQFDVSSDQGTAPFEVELDASGSTDADGRIVRYLWNFGDGRVGDGVFVQHNYVSPGTYTLTLTLIDDRGGQSSESVTITVQAPVSGYTGSVTSSVETPLVNQSVVFDASRLVSDGSAFTYLWDFGDGTTSTGAQPTHTYTAPGVYLVSVVVTDENGLQTTRELWVTVTKAEGPSTLPPRNDEGTGLLVYPVFDDAGGQP